VDLSFTSELPSGYYTGERNAFVRHGLIEELIRWEAHAGAHRPALRCGVAVGVPLVLLVLLGRFELAGFAGFGAFTAFYGRFLRFPFRSRQQALIGALLTANVGIGLLAAHLPGAPWGTFGVLVLLTAVMAVIAEVVGWKPAGPMFFVFAAGASSAMPAHDASGILLAVGVTAASAAFSVLVGAAGGIVRRDGWQRGPLRVARVRDVLARGSGSRSTLVDVVLAVAFAGLLTAGAGLDHGYWALIAAVVPFSVPGPTKRLARGLLRIGGTCAGLAVAAVVIALDLPAWAVIVAIVVAQLGAELFVMRNYGIALLFITPLAMLLGTPGSGGVDTGALLAARLVTTAIGIAAGIVVLAVRHRATSRTAPAASGRVAVAAAPEPART
jgi:hypothetical protein